MHTVHGNALASSPSTLALPGPRPSRSHKTIFPGCTHSHLHPIMALYPPARADSQTPYGRALSTNDHHLPAFLAKPVSPPYTCSRAPNEGYWQFSPTSPTLRP